MKITEVKNRTPELTERLLGVWEDSVRATHRFLSDSEIGAIKAYVPQALNGVAHLLTAEDEAGRPVAFMGIENGVLEMLFIAPAERGKGLGGAPAPPRHGKLCRRAADRERAEPAGQRLL